MAALPSLAQFDFKLIYFNLPRFIWRRRNVAFVLLLSENDILNINAAGFVTKNYFVARQKYTNIIEDHYKNMIINVLSGEHLDSFFQIS